MLALWKCEWLCLTAIVCRSFLKPQLVSVLWHQLEHKTGNKALFEASWHNFTQALYFAIGNDIPKSWALFQFDKEIMTFKKSMTYFWSCCLLAWNACILFLCISSLLFTQLLKKNPNQFQWFQNWEMAKFLQNLV